MNVRKALLLLILTIAGSSAFAQYGGEPEAPSYGNMWVVTGSGPDKQGEPNPIMEQVYLEDYYDCQGKEPGWRGEEDYVWRIPSAQVELKENKSAAFNTETAYVFPLKKDTELSLREASYRVAQYDSVGEYVMLDGNDELSCYIPWKGRVDFKFMKENTENGPVLKVVSHVVNPHGVRLEKAAIKVRENKEGLSVEINMPKAVALRWIWKSFTLKFLVIDLREQLAQRELRALLANSSNK